MNSILDLRTQKDYGELIKNKLAECLHCAADKINEHQSIMELGLSSINAISLVGEITHAVQKPLPETLFYDYDTAADIAKYLYDLSQGVEETSSTFIQNEQEMNIGAHNVIEEIEVLLETRKK